MRKQLLLTIALMCAGALGARAETTPVMRFVPVAGTEIEVPLNTLRKVVFTPDSVVLIAAADDTPTPMYKYDYRAIVFGESSGTGVAECPPDETGGTASAEGGVKFLQNGQLYIRRDEQVYDIMGRKR